MRRLPVWLKIFIPAVLLAAVIGAALYMVATEEVPPFAEAEAIQARYGPQLGALREMAESVPIFSCSDGESDIEAMRERIEALHAWQERAQEHRALFADSAILGAELVLFCDGEMTSRVGISPMLEKDYEEPAVPLSRALLADPTEWPAVSLWYDQARRTVRYENRFEKAEDEGEARGFRLYMDLEALAILEPVPGG